MNKFNNSAGYSQRQLRVAELVKKNVGEILIRGEAKITEFDSKLITVTEVRMTPDLKSARIYIIPLGGNDMKKAVNASYEAILKKKNRYFGRL